MWEEPTVEEPVAHGVDLACYAGGPGEPYFQPTISCTCGWSSGRCDSWEDAGKELDEHLEENK